MNVQKSVKAKPKSPASVEQQLTSAVDRARLRKKPFDHIYMEGVLDPATYDALLAAMPDRRFYHDLKHHDAVRKDGSSTRLRMYLYPELLRRMPEKQRCAWMPVARALCSRELELAFKRKFRRALEERFGKPAEKIGVYPIPILLRDQPGYRIRHPQRRQEEGDHRAVLHAVGRLAAAHRHDLPRKQQRSGGGAHNSDAVHAVNRLRFPGFADEELA